MIPRRRTRLVLGLITPAILLIAWQAAYSLKLASPTLLPSVGSVFHALFRLIASDNIFPDFGMTVLRMAAGFGLAAIVGVAVGLGMGAFWPLYYATVPAMDFFRSIPVTTLYPIFVLTLGVSHASKIGMVFTASVFVIALNSAYGVFQSNKTRAQMAKLYGASPFQVFRWIVFFDALPQTMIGLRIGLSYALIVEILCEMFMGSQLGLGQRVVEAFTTYSIDLVFGIVLLTGILGFALNRVFVLVEARVVPWSQR
jgi:NitT/TauT family transport system permease protein